MDKINRINPLLEILRSSPRRLNKIYLQKEGGRRPIGEIVALAKTHHIPYLFAPKRALDHLSPHHQGVIALVASKEFVPIEDILSLAGRPFFVLLDEVEDPQNMGAIFRSAEGAGVNGIIVPERRSAGLTEVVAQVSAGALEHLRVARVANLAQAMEDLKKRGIWLVGAEASSREYFYEFDYTQPVGLVFGSEGKGLRPIIRKKCDKVLSIPLRGSLNSLNVAAAASVFLFEVARQRSA